MISITTVVHVVLYLIGCGLIFALLNYLIDYIKVPEPWNRGAKIALVVLGVLILIYLILSFMNGVPLFVP